MDRGLITVLEAHKFEKISEGSLISYPIGNLFGEFPSKEETMTFDLNKVWTRYQSTSGSNISVYLEPESNMAYIALDFVAEQIQIRIKDWNKNFATTYLPDINPRDLVITRNVHSSYNLSEKDLSILLNETAPFCKKLFEGVSHNGYENIAQFVAYVDELDPVELNDYLNTLPERMSLNVKGVGKSMLDKMLELKTYTG